MPDARSLPLLARLSLAVLLGGALTLPIAGRTAHMPVSDVRPGMVGEGVTRLEGGARVAFKAHLLGVLDNVIGPRRQIVLARLEGANLEYTGVIAGMSGSPVYVDGRLLGAVAYSLGQFSKEPIAGITPIGEMLDATAPAATARGRAVAAPPYDLALDAESLLADWRRTLASPQVLQVHPRTALDGLEAAAGRGLSLVPITTPLTLGGFTSDATALIGDLLGPAGFVPVTGEARRMADAEAAAAADEPGPLAPGDAVGVSLVGGDLSLGATGTVTYVDGARVVAFGHPFFGLGPTRLPMTRADVVTVVPSLLNSIKLASMGPVIGTVEHDRATAIGGTLGPAPRTVPFRITLAAAGQPPRTFSLSVAEDQLFTPLLVYVSAANVLQSYQRGLGAATIRVDGSARINAATLGFDNVYTGDNALMNAAAALAAPLSAVLRSDLGPATIDGIDVTFTTEEQPRTSRLGHVWLSDPRPRAGSDVTLHVESRTYGGGPVTRTLTVPVPSHAAGTPLQLQVVDGSTLAQQEGRRRTIEQARTIEELVALLNGSRRGDRWYVRLVRQARGTVVGGRDMPALPGTVLTVLDGVPSAGSLDIDVLGEWELPAEAVAIGQRTLTFTPPVP